MEITAKLRNLRISPRKARRIADLVRGMEADAAQISLKFLSQRAAEPILKLINSALANAKKNNSIEQGLFIKKIFVDQGQVYKRYRPAPRGIAMPISKKTSHITIVLDKK